MVSIREYLLSIICAALLCSILRSICTIGAWGNLINLLCGVFLIFTIMNPLTQVRLQEFQFQREEIRSQAEDITQQGIDYARQAQRRIIQEQLCAYILDKAADYGAEPEIEITLSSEDPPIPEEIMIRGELSPYIRQQLQKTLEKDLQISGERLIWIH